MSIPLEPDRETRQELSDRVVSHLLDWYDRASEMEASGTDLDQEALQRLRRPPGDEGRDLDSVLTEIELAGRPGIYHPSGGHMSYIPNAGMYSAAVADFLAAGLNRYTGISGAAPGFAAIEHGVIDWMTDLFALGPDSSGLLLSGGSMANLTAVVTARYAKLGDHFTAGVIYVTPHTHHSLEKAARIVGFRADQVVPVAVDSDLRMSPSALAAQIEADKALGKDPFLLVASAGTTDTGAVDPLRELADVAKSEGLWLHIDAAYGGFFQLTERGRAVLAGIEGADSIALDPHKGLSIPFGVGALLVREESALVDAHQGRGAYLRDEDGYMGVRDIAALGPELSRPFRGLQVWLPLHLHGVGAFREFLDHCLDLAGHAYDRLTAIEGIDARWRPPLSLVAFGFVDDDRGRAALAAVNADKAVHLSPTVVDGRFILRFAMANRRTTTDHVDHAIDIIEKTLIG